MLVMRSHCISYTHSVVLYAHHSTVLQVFPEHKFLIVEALRQEGFKVGMTGDGVNDAPGMCSCMQPLHTTYTH
jgi:hypothetical protein